MEKLGLLLGVFVGVVLIAVLLAWPLMWLWNHTLVPAVNGVNPIGFLQAWGILILSNILFKTSTSAKSN